MSDQIVSGTCTQYGNGVVSLKIKANGRSSTRDIIIETTNLLLLFKTRGSLKGTLLVLNEIQNTSVMAVVTMMVTDIFEMIAIQDPISKECTVIKTTPVSGYNRLEILHKSMVQDLV